MWREKNIQDANVYIQNDPYLVKNNIFIYMHICVEKILEGNATKCFHGYLGIVDLWESFYVFSIFSSFSKFPILSG